MHASSPSNKEALHHPYRTRPLTLQLRLVQRMALLLTIRQPRTVMILQHPVLAAEVPAAELAVAHDLLRERIAHGQTAPGLLAWLRRRRSTASTTTTASTNGFQRRDSARRRGSGGEVREGHGWCRGACDCIRGVRNAALEGQGKVHGRVVLDAVGLEGGGWRGEEFAGEDEAQL